MPHTGVGPKGAALLSAASCRSGWWRYFTAPPAVPAVLQVIEGWVASNTSEQVMAAMNAARVPAGPILSTADIAAEPQYQERGMLQKTAPPSGEFLAGWWCGCGAARRFCLAQRAASLLAACMHGVGNMHLDCRTHPATSCCCHVPACAPPTSRRSGGDSSCHAAGPVSNTRRHSLGGA